MNRDLQHVFQTSHHLFSRLIIIIGLLLCLLPHYPLLAAETSIEKQADIPYGNHPQQTIDVYLPPADQRNQKILVMVHGGAWRFGDKGNSGVVENKIARWLPEGYIFVSVNYRLLPEFGPDHQADDLAKAMVKIQQSADSWGALPEKIILMGHSAGAHLSALLTADVDRTKAENIKPWLGTILLDSTILDLQRFMTARHAPVYSRTFGHDEKLWAELSPLNKLQKDTPPTLLVCTTKRKTSCQESERYMDKSQKLGNRADILKVDLSHTAINQTLGNQSNYTRSVDEFIESIGG